MNKLTVIGVLFVALAALAFSTSARSAAAAGPPAGVSVSASAAGCGGPITAQAVVVDTQGFPAIGVTVSFTSTGGGVGTGVTSGAGVAQAVLSMPATYVGVVQVTAQAGTAIGSTAVNVNCAPGVCGYGINCVNPGCPTYGCVTNYPYTAPYNCTYRALYVGFAPTCVTAPVAPVVTAPYVYGYGNGCYYNNCAPAYNLQSCYGTCYGGAPAKINIAVNPGSLTCGGAASVTANVTDGYGVPVPNGTAVSFSTSLGTIQNSGVSGGGNAVATLSTSAGTSGVALITVKAGNASNTTTIQVACVQQVQNVVVYKPGAGQIAQPGPQVIYRPEQGQGRPQGGPRNAPAGVPAFGPPRTGSAGLLDATESDDAANVTPDAFDNQTNANVDTMMSDLPAALVDGNQIGDSAASASLALEVAPFLGASAN
jgi:hypothetical protein